MGEVWRCDGYRVNDNLVVGVESRDGLYGTPSVVSRDSKIAGRHGMLSPARRSLGAGGFSLSVWIAGETRTQMEARYDELLRSIVRTDRLSRWTRTRDDGSVRVCWGYVSERFEPRDVARDTLRLNVAVTVPSGRWESENIVDSGFIGPIAGRINLPTFASATAPMDNLVYTLRGPIIDGRLTDARTGRGFTNAGVVASGASAPVDAGAWSAPNVATLVYDGPTFLDLQPGDFSGPPALLLTGANQTGITAVRVQGRIGWLA